MNFLNRARFVLVGVLIFLTASGALLFAQGVFRFDGPLSRIITPNGDSLNDIGIICFDNFADSEVEAKIYTLLGAQVAVLRKVNARGGCPAGNREQYFEFEPRALGLRNGVYVYQVKAEGLSFSGTFLVVR
jgi:hypothetical protein